MFNKKTIIKLLKHVSKHRQGFYDKRTTHPTREWLSGLVAFVGIVVLGSLQSADSFLNYQNINTEGGVFQEQVAGYSRPVAETALSIYSKRKDAFVSLQTNSAQSTELISEPVTASSTPDVVEEEVEATSTEESVPGGVEMVN